METIDVVIPAFNEAAGIARVDLDLQSGVRFWLPVSILDRRTLPLDRVARLLHPIERLSRRCE